MIKEFILSNCKVLLGVVLSFFAPITPLVLLVGGAIIADTVMGVWGAMKKGEVFSSRRFSDIISKMLIYQCVLLFGFTLDVFLVGEFFSSVFTIDNIMTKVVALTLIYAEVVSIDENIQTITGKNFVKYLRELISKTKKLKNVD